MVKSSNLELRAPIQPSSSMSAHSLSPLGFYLCCSFVIRPWLGSPADWNPWKPARLFRADGEALTSDAFEGRETGTKPSFGEWVAGRMVALGPMAAGDSGFFGPSATNPPPMQVHGDTLKTMGMAVVTEVIGKCGQCHLLACGLGFRLGIMTPPRPFGLGR